MTTNCSQLKAPDEDNEHADELPFFGYANRLLQQLSRWLNSDDLGSKVGNKLHFCS